MCNAEELCFDALDSSVAGIIFEACLLFYSFIALALICDRYLVPALETMCVRWSIREDVAGASIMAFGSAAPEIVINSIGTIKGGSNSDLGTGAIIGSGFIAFLVIPGLCGIVASKPLHLKRRPLLRDASVYLLALALLCVFFADGVIRTYEAAVLVMLYIIYIVLIFFAPGVQQTYQAFTHRKRLWLSIRAAVASGAPAHDLVQLRETFLQEPRRKSASEKNFVVEAAEERERERLRQLEADGGSSSMSSAPKSPSAAAAATEDGNSTVQVGVDAMENGGGVSDGGKLPFSRMQISNSESYREHDSALDGADRSNFDEDEDDDDKDASPRHHPSHILVTASPSPDDDESANNPSASPVVPTLRQVEEPPTRLQRYFAIFTWPLNWLFDHTCKSCEWDSENAKYYPLTFLVSFAWVSAFSFLVSTCVGRWVERSGVSQSFFGLVLVAIGAEIPDLIQSVTVARRGYGSLAVANSCGSQITNILIGLGLPWFFAGCRVEANKDLPYVTVADHATLQVAAFFQFANLTLFVIMLLLMAVLQNTSKAILTKTKGYIFLAAYCGCLAGYAIYVFA